MKCQLNNVSNGSNQKMNDQIGEQNSKVNYGTNIIFWNIEKENREKRSEENYLHLHCWMAEWKRKGFGKKNERFDSCWLVGIFSVVLSDALVDDEKKCLNRGMKMTTNWIIEYTTLFQVENRTKYNKTNRIIIVNNSKVGLIVVIHHRHALLHRFHFYIQKIILWKHFSKFFFSLFPFKKNHF